MKIIAHITPMLHFHIEDIGLYVLASAAFLAILAICCMVDKLKKKGK